MIFSKSTSRFDSKNLYAFILIGLMIIAPSACKKEETYAVQGKVVDGYDKSLANVTIAASRCRSTVTDHNGNWQMDGRPVRTCNHYSTVIGFYVWAFEPLRAATNQ